MYLPSSFDYSTIIRFFIKQGNSKLKTSEINQLLGKIKGIQSTSSASAKPETQQASERASISSQTTASDKSGELSLKETNSLLKRLDRLLMQAQTDPAHYASAQKQEKLNKASELKTALLSYQALLINEKNQPKAATSKAPKQQTSKVENFSPPRLIGQYENWMSSFKQTKRELRRSRPQAIRRKNDSSNSDSSSSDEAAKSPARSLKDTRLKTAKSLSFITSKNPQKKETKSEKKEPSQAINTSFSQDISAYFKPASSEGASAFAITLGAGRNGQVISDPSDPTYVIKRFSPIVLGEQIPIEERIKTAVEETSLFNQYYGEESAEVIEQKGNVFIRMIKVPGISLDQCIKENRLPKNIGLLLMDLIIRLNECRIIHMDFHPGNILYDPSLNTLFPIDLSNEYNIYYESSDDEKEQVNKAHSYYFNRLIEAAKKQAL